MALKDAQTAKAAEKDQRELAQGEAARAKAAEEGASLRAAELEQVVLFQEAQMLDVNPSRMGIGMRNRLIAAVRTAMGRSTLGKEAIDERQAAFEIQLEGVNFTDLALDTIDADLIEQTLVSIDEKFDGQPQVMARPLQTQATILRKLGLLESASEPQERALAIRRRKLGDDHADTLASIIYMGTLLYDQGQRLTASHCSVFDLSPRLCPRIEAESSYRNTRRPHPRRKHRLEKDVGPRIARRPCKSPLRMA